MRPATIVATEHGFMRCQTICDGRGIPVGVRVQPVATFVARIKDSYWSYGKLYRVIVGHCAGQWSDRDFQVTVSDRQLANPRSMELALLNVGGLGVLFMPGCRAAVVRAIVDLSEEEYSEVTSKIVSSRGGGFNV